jgi:hypothetical protein
MCKRLAPEAFPPAASFLRIHKSHSIPSTTDSPGNVTGEVSESSPPSHHPEQVAQFLVQLCRRKPSRESHKRSFTHCMAISGCDRRYSKKPSLPACNPRSSACRLAHSSASDGILRPYLEPVWSRLEQGLVPRPATRERQPCSWDRNSSTPIGLVRAPVS